MLINGLIMEWVKLHIIINIAWLSVLLLVIIILAILISIDVIIYGRKARFLKNSGYIFHKGYGNNCPYDLRSRFVNESTRDIIYVHDMDDLPLKNIKTKVNRNKCNY